MQLAKSDIFSRLRREILPLEGFYTAGKGETKDPGLGFMREAFPNKAFPLGAVHELMSSPGESAAAATGFTAAVISSLMKNGGAAVWIGKSPTLFPPALQAFGIRPDQIIFINLKKEKDILWSVEEALKCADLAAVIGELPNIPFTSSRRFQMAVEQSRVTGFLLNYNRKPTPNSCIARWKIHSLPSFSEEGLPGISFPRWQIDLLKIRNGKPGSYTFEWREGKIQEVQETLPSVFVHPLQPQRQTG